MSDSNDSRVNIRVLQRFSTRRVKAEVTPFNKSGDPLPPRVVTLERTSRDHWRDQFGHRFTAVLQ
jgi:hypothetical protein